MNIPANLQSAFTRHNHPFLMWDGIQLIPEAIRNVIENTDVQVVSEQVKNHKKFYLTGCGTSLFAAQAASYAFQHLTDATAIPLNAFEFSAYPPQDLDESILVGISHTGGTPVVYESLKLAKSKNIPSISITDKKDSKIEKISNLCLSTSLGTEPAMPKTWSYVAALVRLYILAIAKSASNRSAIETNLQKLADLAQTTQEMIQKLEPEINSFAKSLQSSNYFAVAGGGPLVSTANEAALKLTEAALVKSIGWEIEESAHGAWASTGESDWVIVNAVKGPSFEKALKLAEGMKKIDAKVWAITDQPDAFKGADMVTDLPAQYPEWLMPIPAIIPLYLFTYYLSISRGINPDIMRLNDDRYLKARQSMRQTIE